MRNNGKPVKGHASHMQYELAKDFVVLTGSSMQEQRPLFITGDKITYTVKGQKMGQLQRERQTRHHRSELPSAVQDKNKRPDSAPKEE